MPTAYPEHSAILNTPFGARLLVRSNGAQIVHSEFVRTTRAAPPVRDALLKEAQRQVAAYVRKRLLRFDLPLQFEGTPFECGVWTFVSQMETGELISYGDLARMLGKPRAARGVARAMARSPYDLFVPAHRVIGADGSVRGAAPNGMRRKLLVFEGYTSARTSGAIRP